MSFVSCAHKKDAKGNLILQNNSESNDTTGEKAKPTELGCLTGASAQLDDA